MRKKREKSEGVSFSPAKQPSPNRTLSSTTVAVYFFDGRYRYKKEYCCLCPLVLTPLAFVVDVFSGNILDRRNGVSC